MGDPLGLTIGKPSAMSVAKAMEQRFGPLADAVLMKEKVITDKDSRVRLIEAVARAMDQAALLNVHRAGGDYRPDPDVDRFPEWKDREAAVMQAGKPKASMTTLFKAWVTEAERLGRAPKTISRYKPSVAQFIKFIDHDDAEMVTPLDIRRWRTALMEAGTVTAATFAKVNRAAISTIFEAGIEQGLLSVNPAKGMNLKRETKRSTRETERTFTEGEAKTILRAASGALEAPGRQSHHTRLARRWVPWLAAYSGARVGELCQLRKGDVQVKGGVSFFRITPEAGTVKSGKARAIPIHDHLKDQGFLEFVAKAPDGPLFFRIDQRDGKGSSSTTAQRLATWVRSVGIDDHGVILGPMAQARSH